MRRWLLVCVSLLLAIPLQAQTATSKLIWDQPLATGHTFADVQAYAYTLKVDNGTASLVTATCTAGTPIRCTTPLPALPSGAHTLTLTATNGFGSASSALSGAPPLGPVSVSVTVTVTIP